MNISEINENTKLKDITKAYPWLIDEIKKRYPQAAKINNTVIKLAIGKYDIKGAAKKAGVSTDEVLKELNKILAEHEG